MNLSSLAALLPSPYATVYAGAKAFNLAWGASLKVEMRAEGHDIDVLGIVIAQAQSAVVKKETSFFVPSSREMAMKALKEAGCGRKWVTPVLGHVLQQWFTAIVPEWLLERLVIMAVRKVKADSESREHMES